MIANTVAEFSREAARRYLQSAVFIDDKIYVRSTAALIAPEVDEVRKPKPAIFADPEVLDSEPPLADLPQTDPPFRTQDLVGSFAMHGIVCAPYEPPHNFDTCENSTLFKLCETADLVILDWDFHQDGLTGRKPKDLIARLVTRGNSVAPHHVRLIAIYTTTPSLSKVSSTLFEHLNEKNIPVEPEEGDRLRLQCGSTRLIVLGKPGTGRIDEENHHVVEEKDLADRLLQEFSKMDEGLLPSCALLGMAAVRRNSRRILDKFSAKLDGQFLLHRALVIKSEDAFDQLPELLADEFRAAIEDSDTMPGDFTSLVATALQGLQTTALPENLQAGSAAELLQKFLEQGDAEAAGKMAVKFKEKRQEIAEIFSTPGGNEHLQFGELLSGRTSYRDGSRSLCFGTIVREILPHGGEPNGIVTSICLMPACDSIRLDATVGFPFWLLDTEGKGDAQCVHTPEGTFQKLVLRGKIRDKLWMDRFSPNSSGKVVFAKTENRQIVKAGTREFEWVAQLKPAHAQRLAHAVGQSFSRVGLTEAEWLRLAHA